MPEDDKYKGHLFKILESSEKGPSQHFLISKYSIS